jgi:hypothetical protein
MGWNAPLVYGYKTLGAWSVEPRGYGFIGGLGVDSRGNVHTAYHPMSYPPDRGDGAHYAVKTAGIWSDEKIESDSWVPSLIVDRTDIVRVAYTATKDTSLGNVSSLRFGSRISGTWVMSDVRSGDEFAVNIHEQIAVDSKGQGYIAYVRSRTDSGSAFSELMLAAQTSGGWTLTTIDTMSAETPSWNNIVDMTIDGEDHLHMLYWDETNYYTDGPYIKYATNASGAWVSFILVRNAFYPAIAVDKNNKIHGVYNSYFGDVKYLSNVSGTWVDSTIETMTPSADILSDITVDETGRVHIIYYEPGDVGLLKYARYPAVTGIAIDKLATPDPVMVSEDITCKITIKNHGPLRCR